MIRRHKEAFPLHISILLICQLMLLINRKMFDTKLFSRVLKLILVIKLIWNIEKKIHWWIEVVSFTYSYVSKIGIYSLFVVRMPIELAFDISPISVYKFICHRQTQTSKWIVNLEAQTFSDWFQLSFHCILF